MSEQESQFLKELRSWQDRMEGLLLHNHETPPKTYSELFGEMAGKIQAMKERICKIDDTVCERKKAMQPILEAQAGVSSIGKLYKYIPVWVKIWAVGLISWMLGNRISF